MSVAGGRYTAVLREGRWIVRAPDARCVAEFGQTTRDENAARAHALRLNEKLKSVSE